MLNRRAMPRELPFIVVGVNVEDPILVTPLGIVTLVNPMQLRNVENQMRVTESGIVTLVRSLQL